jgi:hypothetical protein
VSGGQFKGETALEVGANTASFDIALEELAENDVVDEDELLQACSRVRRRWCI